MHLSVTDIKNMSLTINITNQDSFNIKITFFLIINYTWNPFFVHVLAEFFNMNNYNISLRIIYDKIQIV